MPKKTDPAGMPPPLAPDADPPANIHAEMIRVLKVWAERTMGDDWKQVVVTVVAKGQHAHDLEFRWPEHD